MIEAWDWNRAPVRIFRVKTASKGATHPANWPARGQGRLWQHASHMTH
jgi:hypothetical protein